MQHVGDVTTTQRILVNIFDLLPHLVVGVELLRMIAFLPQLISLARFVAKFVEGKFLKQSGVLALLQCLDNRFRGERFEISDAIRQPGTDGDPVEVVLHDHECQDFDFTLPLQESPAIQYKPCKLRMRKDG